MSRARSLFTGAALLALLVHAAPARAAFEDVEVSPRLRALGGAGAALERDAYAALHNPAALAGLDGVAGAGSYLQPFSLPFASQNTVAATLPLPGGAGGLGLAVRSFGVRYQDTRLDQETTVSLAHGFRLLRDAQSALSFGWTLSLYSLSFGTSVTGMEPGSASTLGLGLGAVAVVRDRTRVGFAVQNLNNPSIGDLDHEQLGRRVSGGLAYTPYAGVTTVVDMAAGLGGAVEYRGGVELAATDFLTLRAGVCTEPNAFSAGLGLRLRALRLDYGYSSGGVLGDTHHIGLEVRTRSPWGARP